MIKSISMGIAILAIVWSSSATAQVGPTTSSTTTEVQRVTVVLYRLFYCPCINHHYRHYRVIFWQRGGYRTDLLSVFRFNGI